MNSVELKPDTNKHLPYLWPCPCHRQLCWSWFHHFPSSEMCEDKPVLDCSRSLLAQRSEMNRCKVEGKKWTEYVLIRVGGGDGKLFPSWWKEVEKSCSYYAGRKWEGVCLNHIIRYCHKTKAIVFTISHVGIWYLLKSLWKDRPWNEG